MTTGGMSYFGPRVGLACDNVKNYEIVLASGQVINANVDDHKDLLIALRGGGNNFGVVTRTEVRAFEQGRMWGGGIFYDISTASQHVTALYNLNRDPKYDEYATVIQSFGYAPGLGLGVGNNYEYTKPVASPSAFNEFLAVKPELSNSMRISNLTDITIEQANFSPPGVR
jgi:FAD/FMN-containing dehydrogenase